MKTNLNHIIFNLSRRTQTKLKYSSSETVRSAKWACLLITLIVAGGCKKFVEVDPPVTSLVTPSVFANTATATAAQTVIYTRMYTNSESSKMAINTGLLGDEFKNYSTAAAQVQLYTNAMIPTTSPSWNTWYNYIYQANANIEGLAKYGGGSVAAATQLTAEAKFVRAFCYINLVNLYGDVPLITTTDYNVNGSMIRTAASEVYKQIINDLVDAQTSLNENYVDVDDVTVTPERVRPNKWAATALLARAYLYSKDYVNADKQSTSILTSATQYRLNTNLDSVFLKNNREAIWQIMTPGPSSYNTSDGNTFVLRAAPTNVAMSDQLLNSFETGDNRKVRWVGSFKPTTSITTYYFPNKYKAIAASPTTEYVMVLRLAEQYLIRAEAKAQQGNTSDAITDLNTIRNRSGLPNYSGATDKANVLTAIIHERQVELFTEWGHRWFDMKRLGVIDAVMGTVSPLKGGVWSPYKQLLPIFQTDINVNSNLVQNPGY